MEYYYNSSLKNNIWKFYVNNFVSMFSLLLPFLVYYFQELNFNLTQIAFLISLSYIAIIIFEIPSGYVADIIGRKKSLLISSGLSIIAVLILYLSSDYYLIALSQILGGIAFAFFSGADTALLYDTLLELKKENKYQKYFGISNFFGEISVILASLVGAFVISYGMGHIILISLIVRVLLFFLTLTFQEPTRHKNINKMSFNKKVSNMFLIIKESLSHKKILGLFIYSFIILGLSNLIFSMYQIYFKAVNLPLPWYGYIFAIFSVFTGVIALFTHKIENKLGVFKSLIIMPIFLIISFLGAGFVFVKWGLVFFFFREMVRGFVFPVLSDYKNRLIASERRATVSSISGIFSRLGTSTAAITFGYFADLYSLQTTYILFGIILAILFIPIAIILYYSKKNAPLAE